MSKYQAKLLIGNVLLGSQKHLITLRWSALTGNPYEAYRREKERTIYLTQTKLWGAILLLLAVVFAFMCMKAPHSTGTLHIIGLGIACSLMVGLNRLAKWGDMYDRTTSEMAKLWRDNCRKFEQVNLPWFLSKTLDGLPTSDDERRILFLLSFDVLAKRIMSLIIVSEFEPKGLFNTLKNPPNASGPGHVEFQLTEDMRQKAYRLMGVIEELVVLFGISSKPKEWRHNLHQNLLHQVFIPDSKKMNTSIILHPEVLNGDVTT